MIIDDKYLRARLLTEFFEALDGGYFDDQLINHLAEKYYLMLRILSQHLNIEVPLLRKIVMMCKPKKEEILEIISSDVGKSYLIIRYQWLSNS